MSRTYRRSQYKETYRSNVESYVRHHHLYSWYVPAPGAMHGPVDCSWYLKLGRDGCKNDYHKSTRSRGFREDTNHLIRHDNRTKIGKLLKDPDLHDEFLYATQWEGKHIAWSYW